jgi:hypothetical protein
MRVMPWVWGLPLKEVCRIARVAHVVGPVAHIWPLSRVVGCMVRRMAVWAGI